MGSHPPKTKSERSAKGTKSRIKGMFFSVTVLPRLPMRMRPIWVKDPMGRPKPFLADKTPAMKVVETAPMPGSSTPSFPFAGAIFLFAILVSLLVSDLKDCFRPKSHQYCTKKEG